MQRSSGFCYSTNFMLFHLRRCAVDTLAQGPEIHLAAFGWHCSHAWLVSLGMMLCKGPAVSGFGTGSAIFAARFWLWPTWHNAHNEWVIHRLLQDSGWQSWFWIRALWISVQRNFWILWQLEKKAVESHFLCIEKGEEEEDQLMVLHLRMKRAVIPTNKVTFILFSVHWLYNFSEKSITNHHTRPETEWELLLVWSGFLVMSSCGKFREPNLMYILLCQVQTNSFHFFSCPFDIYYQWTTQASCHSVLKWLL